MTAKLEKIQTFSLAEDLQHFSEEVLEGLNRQKKHISSKYFYDEKGSQLYTAITHHADYYLTNSDLYILNQYKEELSQRIPKDFNLIELGPGEGIKARLLIEQFLRNKHRFTYFTIDISPKYLQQIVQQFNAELPHLAVTALNSDYFRGIRWLTERSRKPNLLLFLGSSIGNFNLEDTHYFLHGLWHDLHDGDYCLIGFDLRKNIDVLLKAYNDSSGLTKQFNLNLLSRINHELGGHFDLQLFEHYGTYNVYKGAMESYLISLCEQNITIEALNQAFHFDAYEPLHLEVSYKYTLRQIEDYAQGNGFALVKNFFDPNHWFVNSLWRVVK